MNVLMTYKGVKKYLINPSLGLLASILYMLLFWITQNVSLSLLISILFSAAGEIVVRMYSRTVVCSMIFLTNFIALSLTLIIWLLVKDVGATNIFYIIVYEMIFFALLVTTRSLKTYINIYMGRKKPSPAQKTFLSEYFEIVKFTQYSITFYLFVVLIYRYIYENIKVEEPADSIFYFGAPIIFAAAIIIFYELKMRNIVKYLRKEQWLPIVDEKGQVTGRVAKSVSDKMKNKFMHPVVRIALVHENQVYLQKRSSDDILDSDTYDYPFEKYILFNHEINIAVRNSITKALGMQELPFNFLLKYIYENDDTKRLIFLFVSHIENEEQLKSIKMLKGKFWTMKQIEDGFSDDGVFSECFQLEYEYLKNTVLRPQLQKEAFSSAVNSSSN